MGTCVFCDGDVSRDTLRGLVEQAAEVIAKDGGHQLDDVPNTQRFGPYLAAMWTAKEELFDTIHSHLIRTDVY
jgi:hypothetical protein